MSMLCLEDMLCEVLCFITLHYEKYHVIFAFSQALDCSFQELEYNVCYERWHLFFQLQNSLLEKSSMWMEVQGLLWYIGFSQGIHSYWPGFRSCMILMSGCVIVVEIKLGQVFTYVLFCIVILPDFRVNMTVCLLLKVKIRVKRYRFSHPSLIQVAAQKPKFQNDG